MSRFNELPMNELPLERFTFKSGRLVAELSDLGIRAGQNFIQQIWNDACDEGIAIRSHHTNKVERFYFSSTDKDREGDIAGFRFKPCNPKCKVQEVLLIND
jgi:hypothetical protein